ncbi:MAG: ribonuclease III [Geobacter sp.]|nr:ribonuclease III [Geobacter sp.]
MDDLQQRIGYRFGDTGLLREALTHRSYLNETGDLSLKDYNRLEFLGDAVIDLQVTLRLLERFPTSREGDLSRMRAALVDEEALAALARDLDLGDHLLLGKGEERSGGREKRSILADAYEALVGATFLDGGMEAAAKLIDAQMSPLIDDPALPQKGTDFKTLFQESAQSRWGVTPRYALKETSGPDHLRTFCVQAFVEDRLLAEGCGRSRKEAEQAAARAALEQLKESDGA